METTAAVTNESQQQQQQHQHQPNLLLLEGPNVMQQALQTFRTDESGGKLLLQQQQQHLQQPAAFPFFNANAAMSVPLSLSNHHHHQQQQQTQQQQQQQQQMQWHQALQSFAAVQSPPLSSVPTATAATTTTTTTTASTDSVNAAAAAAVAAAAVPFLASLTIPHLMQFNQQMQQPPPPPQPPMVRTSPPLLLLNTNTGSAVQPPEPSVSTTNTDLSKITTATKRKYPNGPHDPGGNGSSTTTASTKQRSQKRALAKNNKTSSSIVSASVASSSHNSSSGFGGTTISSSSSTLHNHPRTNSCTTTSHYSHLNNHSDSINKHNNSNNNIEGMDNLQPPQEKSAAILEKMTASERRRYDRNLREQQRSYRISQQIKELRDVLQQSNVPFRPNKYSILVSVAEYIQQLQGRAIMLDAEHERLIQTIRSTTEATTCGTSHDNITNNNNNNNIGNSENGSLSFTSNSKEIMDDPVAAYRCSSHNDENTNINNNNNNSIVNDDRPTRTTTSHPDSLLFVPGIDYEAAFVHCPYPLGVATLDGRLIAVNREFERLLNPSYTAVVVPTKQYHFDNDVLLDSGTSMTSASSTNHDTNTMIDQSFFVFIRNHQEIFEAMAALLKQSTASIERGEGTITNSPNLLFWHGQVVSSRNESYPFTITLTNTQNDNPKYFNLSAARGA